MTFLTLNYFVGQTIVSLVSACVIQLRELVISLAIASYILLEDFYGFFVENIESLLTGVEFITSAVEQLLYLLTSVTISVRTSILSGVSSIGQLISGAVASAAGAFNSVIQFFHLIGASLLLLINIVPQTVQLIYNVTKTNLLLSLNLISSSVKSVCQLSISAPVESLIGVTATCVIAFSSYKIVRKLVLSHNLSWSWIARVTLRLLCLIYLQFCLFLIALGTGVARSVEFTLTHLHVPRFHHAGDVSDDEDDDISVNENQEYVRIMKCIALVILNGLSKYIYIYNTEGRIRSLVNNLGF
jgi:hypothetical protein